MVVRGQGPLFSTCIHGHLSMQTQLLLDSLLDFNSIDTSITNQTDRSSWTLEEANLELPQLAGQQAMFTLETVPFINDYG